MEPIFVIENKKGSYKSFAIENDPLWEGYPLSGVTYPVDYGRIEGYRSEDGEDLDVFVGSGSLNGYIRIWRCDVPLETKFVCKVTKEEWEQIIATFSPVLKKSLLFASESDFQKLLFFYKR